jgi:PAS domain S-box-containing protein
MLYRMTGRSPISEPSCQRRADKVARRAGGFVVVVGLFVLAGWVLDIPFLKGPVAGLVQMKADTAIGFLALGVALVLSTGEPSTGRRRGSRALAGLAILIGVITLAEYVLGRNLELDQLLFRDASSVHTVHLGRLAPQTAINFVLLGWALLLLSKPEGKSRLVGPLTGISFVGALFAVIGYGYGVPNLAEVPSLTPIALHTAVTFLALSVGIAASKPDGLFVEVLTGEGPGNGMARRLLPLTVLLLPIFGWLTLVGDRHGLYSTNYDIALLVSLATVVLALAVLSLTKRLNRLELKREQAAARAVRLAALVEAANEAIIGADQDGLVTTWNRAAARFYGYAEQEILGRPISILCPPERAAEQRDLLAEVASRSASVEFDTQRLHKSGARLSVSMALSPIVDEGELRGFCVVTHDIQARLRAQDELEEKVRARTRDLALSRAETLQTLARAAEHRDDDTAQHTERVGAMAARLAKSLGLPAGLIDLIAHAAPLHDVGKIGIPDQILLKPGKLTAEEFDAMKQHTILGASLLAGSNSEILQLGEQIALAHHERWDGKGYPAGLAGEEIPIAARIVAVVDTFDAMTHDRPYRNASSTEEALSEIARCSTSQFDPRVVEAFMNQHQHPATRNGLPNAQPLGTRVPPTTNGTSRARTSRTRSPARKQLAGTLNDRGTTASA